MTSHTKRRLSALITIIALTWLPLACDGDGDNGHTDKPNAASSAEDPKHSNVKATPPPPAPRSPDKDSPATAPERKAEVDAPMNTEAATTSSGDDGPKDAKPTPNGSPEPSKESPQNATPPTKCWPSKITKCKPSIGPLLPL